MYDYPEGYPGNKILGRVMWALKVEGVGSTKHTAEPTEDGKLLHTVTWTQRPSPAGT